MFNPNDDSEYKFQQFADRKKREQRRYYARQPKKIADIIAKTIQRNGIGRVLENEQYQEIVISCVDKAIQQFIQVIGIRRGNLEVVVANSIVMQELTYHKETILKKTQQISDRKNVTNVRFRIGPISSQK